MTRQVHQEAAAAITSALREGWLQHNIGRRLPLEPIAEAHELVEQGRGGGKVILEL